MAPRRDTLKITSLNSWKEISLYLDRGIRTVQRWERELGLPVHRVGHGHRSPVHAFPGELQAWILRAGRSAEVPGEQRKHPGALMHPDGSVATARVLVKRSSTLVKQMVDSLWAQQQHAKELIEELELFRNRMNKQLGRSVDGVSPSFAPPPGKRRRKRSLRSRNR